MSNISKNKITADFKKIVVFKDKDIRRTLHDGNWWFVVVDIVAALTDSVNPNDYLKKIRSRDNELSKGWGQIVTLLASGGLANIQFLEKK